MENKNPQEKMLLRKKRRFLFWAMPCYHHQNKEEKERYIKGE